MTLPDPKPLTTRQVVWAVAWRFLLSALLTFLFMCLGCTGTPGHVRGPATSPDPDCLVWSANIACAAEAWRPEVEHRFGKGAFILVCHGGDHRGEFWLYPDPPRVPMPADAAAWMLSDLYDKRLIVFISCNVPGRRLTAPRVWYCRRDVSVWPGFNGPGAADDIYEFRD